MNRINRCFKDDKKKLISFTVISDPDHQTSLEVVSSMIENGADIVELGIPFSDPVAEGPVIQKANERALSSGFCIQKAFEFVCDIRKRYDTPLLFLTYFNIIYRYGIEDFIAKCDEISLDGLIIPDLPYEQQDEIKKFAKEKDINVISLVSLTSKDRIARIAADADEFIYCVSSMGVTGQRNDFSDDIFTLAKELDTLTNKKKAVGFGIKSPKQVSMFRDHFDGVIVGSAFSSICENNDTKNAPAKTGAFTRSMKKNLL
jgi:tryptophan synthase alpha chain